MTAYCDMLLAELSIHSQLYPYMVIEHLLDAKANTQDPFIPLIPLRQPAGSKLWLARTNYPDSLSVLALLTPTTPGRA